MYNIIFLRCDFLFVYVCISVLLICFYFPSFAYFFYYLIISLFYFILIFFLQPFSGLKCCVLGIGKHNELSQFCYTNNQNIIEYGKL